ncbi:Tfx family DNA-binding protein [Salinigranum marinum]|uniref:Tfx family DNA-binding protein n=1 Tax=Salinigranum marinum TaxID=1515595 RepID=UPI00298A05F7|nr:Tfx family DNA-binding protein [Salinigranum marinum]
MDDTDASDADAETSHDGDDGGDVNIDALLDRAGFDPETNVLTRRQAEVLVLRERSVRQATIADRIETSRANVSSIEASARANIEKARETIAFAEALSAPVTVEVDVGTDLYDVPKLVYDACDEAGVKVNYTAPDLMKIVSDAADEAVQGREVCESLLVGVTSDGNVRVRRSTADQ